MLVERGLHWLSKSTRPSHLPASPDQLLFSLGGLEAKALTFFLRAYDGVRCRGLLDVCLRRCIVASCRSDNLAPYLRMSYHDIAELLPAETASAEENRPRWGTASEAAIVSSRVESMIASGVLGAMSSLSDINLCHTEAFTLRHYAQAIQQLSQADRIGFERDVCSVEALRNMLTRLTAIRQAAENLQELVAPIDADGLGRGKICVSSAAYGCPQRWVEDSICAYLNDMCRLECVYEYVHCTSLLLFLLLLLLLLLLLFVIIKKHYIYAIIAPHMLEQYHIVISHHPLPGQVLGARRGSDGSCQCTLY